MALLDGRVDAVVSREPLPTGGLRVAVLYHEPRLLMVARSHRLANRSSVNVEDFADEPIVRYSETIYDAFWALDPRPDGRRATGGPVVATHADKFEAIAGEHPGRDRTQLRRGVAPRPTRHRKHLADQPLKPGGRANRNHQDRPGNTASTFGN